MVRLANDQWLEVAFVLDAGADRTVFSADFLSLLRPLQITESDPSSLVGVGGEAGSITIETAIGFTRDDGKPVSVRGTFRVFTDSAAPT